jgi:hypothetical protein
MDVQIKLRTEECALGMEQKVEQKRCSIDGCTNHVQKGGVCIKHGGKINTYTFDSKFDKTTATLSNQHRGASRASALTSQGQGSLPKEVVICQEVVGTKNYEEV